MLGPNCVTPIKFKLNSNSFYFTCNFFYIAGFLIIRHDFLNSEFRNHHMDICFHIGFIEFLCDVFSLIRV